MILKQLQGKNVFGNFKEKLAGLVEENNSNKKTIWLHAVSVGEVLSIAQLVNAIKKENPQTVCYITCGTSTGVEQARGQLQADCVSFLPFDFLLPMLIAFRRIKPDVLIVVESELWPNLLLLARFKKIPMYLLNARAGSSKNYHKLFKFIMKPLLESFSSIYVQEEKDLLFLSNLGVNKNRLKVMGNVKVSNVLEKQKKSHSHKIKIEKGESLMLLAGSIYQEEAAIYIDLFKKLKSNHNLKMILAPRHFSWHDELLEIIHKAELKYELWNDQTKELVWKCTESDLLIVGRLGLLFDLYKTCDLFLLGGTFVPIGGHNLFEPAVWGKPTLIGPYYANNRAIANSLEKTDALIKVADKEELLKIIEFYITTPQKLEKSGQNARLWLEKEAQKVEINVKSFAKNILTHQNQP